ncbi:MAG: hypothetical protein E7345_04175 [Clostridiales bacterium]|nr:hypothetical protein [Clostridiales bacterium]
MLKNKTKSFRKAMLTTALIGGSILTVGGLAGFVATGNAMTEVEDKLDDKVIAVTQTQEYLEYKSEKERVFYELYKNGEITANRFNQLVDELDSAKYVIDNDIECVSEEDKEEINELNNKTLGIGLASLGAVVACVGGLAVAMPSIHAILEERDEKTL